MLEKLDTMKVWKKHESIAKHLHAIWPHGLKVYIYTTIEATSNTKKSTAPLLRSLLWFYHMFLFLCFIVCVSLSDSLSFHFNLSQFVARKVEPS